MTRSSLRFLLSSLFVLSACFLTTVVRADDPPPAKPRVKLVMASAERVLGDLEWIVSTLAKEDSQWQNNLYPSLDIFLFGVDRNLPIRFDVMIGGEDPGAVNPGTYRYQPSIPIDRGGKDVRTFIKDNLEPIGINVKQRARGGYYSLAEVYSGWMRMVDEYACIGAFESDVPKGMSSPADSHAELVKAGFDVALELDNSAEQTEDRAAAFTVFQDNLVDATKVKDGESEAAFAVRKTSVQQNLETIGTLYRNAKRITIGWVTDVDQESARAELYGEALPDTDLAKFIDSISVEHSVFAALEMPEDPAASLRVNLPYSELRKKQLTENYKLYRPLAHEKIDAAENITSAEKGPAKQIADLLLDMLTAGIDVGRLDLFVDMTTTEAGPHVIVAAVRTADGKQADEIVKLIPQAHTAWGVEMDVESIGGTAIHKVDLSGDLPQALIETFGDSGQVYVGTSADLVWISGGEGSLELLKQTITRVNEAEAPAEVSEVFGEFKLHAHTMLKLYDSLIVEMGWTPFGKIELQPKRPAASDGASMQPIDPAEIRDIATRATADINDVVSGQARRVGNHAEGEINVAPGVLRAVGKIIAKIAADNL